jgi:hypothetical protein
MKTFKFFLLIFGITTTFAQNKCLPICSSYFQCINGVCVPIVENPYTDHHHEIKIGAIATLIGITLGTVGFFVQNAKDNRNAIYLHAVGGVGLFVGIPLWIDGVDKQRQYDDWNEKHKLK